MDVPSVWIIVRWQSNPGAFVAVCKTFEDARKHLLEVCHVRENTNLVHYTMHMFGDENEYAVFEAPLV